MNSGPGRPQAIASGQRTFTGEHTHAEYHTSSQFLLSRCLSCPAYACTLCSVACSLGLPVPRKRSARRSGRPRTISACAEHVDPPKNQQPKGGCNDTVHALSPWKFSGLKHEHMLQGLEIRIDDVFWPLAARIMAQTRRPAAPSIAETSFIGKA